MYTANFSKKYYNSNILLFLYILYKGVLLDIRDLFLISLDITFRIIKTRYSVLVKCVELSGLTELKLLEKYFMLFVQTDREFLVIDVIYILQPLHKV